jgi:hypothetical protein
MVTAWHAAHVYRLCIGYMQEVGRQTGRVRRAHCGLARVCAGAQMLHAPLLTRTDPYPARLRQARFARDQACTKAESQDLKDACTTACQGSCSGTVQAYAASLVERTGLRLLPKDQERLQRSCVRNCAYECSKPGRAFDFVVPWRKSS